MVLQCGDRQFQEIVACIGYLFTPLFMHPFNALYGAPTLNSHYVGSGDTQSMKTWSWLLKSTYNGKPFESKSTFQMHRAIVPQEKDIWRPLYFPSVTVHLNTGWGNSTRWYYLLTFKTKSDWAIGRLHLEDSLWARRAMHIFFYDRGMFRWVLAPLGPIFGPRGQ